MEFINKFYKNIIILWINGLNLWSGTYTLQTNEQMTKYIISLIIEHPSPKHNQLS